jgi:hypothetical protein
MQTPPFHLEALVIEFDRPDSPRLKLDSAGAL